MLPELPGGRALGRRVRLQVAPGPAASFDLQVGWAVVLLRAAGRWAGMLARALAPRCRHAARGVRAPKAMPTVKAGFRGSYAARS
jgi:hypothetical protein